MKATFDFDPNYCPSCGRDLLDQKPSECPKCFCTMDYKDESNALPTADTITVVLSDNPINYAVIGKYAPNDFQWLDICVAYDNAHRDDNDNFVFDLTARQANRLYFELMNNILATFESGDTVNRMAVAEWVQKSYDDAQKINDQIRESKYG